MQGIRKRLMTVGLSAMCLLPALSAWAQVGEPPALTIETDAFTYRLDVDAGQNNHDLILQIAPNGDEEIVYAATRIENFFPSPDEQLIAVIQANEQLMAEYGFGAMEEAPTDLIIVDLETGETEQVNPRDLDVEFWSNMAVSSAAWSPESDQVVYDWNVFSPGTAGEEPSDRELYLYTLADQQTILLANLGGDTLWVRLGWFSENIVVREDIEGYLIFTSDGEQVRQDMFGATPIDECGGLPTRLNDTRDVTVLPGEPNNVRVAPYLDAPVLSQISADDAVQISYGVASICVDGIRFWEVLINNDQSGWTAESADGEYFLTPAGAE